MIIRFKHNAQRAEITVPRNAIEPSDEIKLRIIAWLVSDIGRKLGLDEIELRPDEFNE